MLPCPSRDQLQALLAGQLDDPGSVRVETHLQTCLLCQEVLEQLTANPGEEKERGPSRDLPAPEGCPPGSSGDTEEILVAALKRLPAPQRCPTPTLRRERAAKRPCLPGYDILGELGRGGMGIVFKARHLQLKRLAALKMVSSWAQAKPELLARFRREAEAVARLQHPNIVQIHEVGEHNGQPFFSLEYVDGGSLAQRLAGAPQPPRAAAQLVETLARAVHYAHQRGVIHRDLKPANVLLVGQAFQPDASKPVRLESLTYIQPDASKPVRLESLTYIPKITDFGLAKQLDQDADQTQASAILGTPSYMAPEQAAGSSREIGPPTDVFALGAILYEMLTGRPPFRGQTALDTLQLLRTVEPVPVRQLQPGVPRDLETICLKCLRKEPAQRYASALDLAEDLAQFRAGLPIRARPMRAPERAWRWCRRNPGVAALGAAVCLLLVALVASALISNVWLGRERDRAVANERAADRARQEAEESLRVSYLAQVKAERRAGQVGRRVTGLDLLARAAVIRTDLPLRNEAAACLALTDLELVKQWPIGLHHPIGLAFDAPLERYAYGDHQGRISIRSLADDRELMGLPGPGQPAWILRFSPDGRYLAAKHHAADSNTREVQVWDVQGPLPRHRTFAGMPWDFSPDGRHLVTNLDGGVLVLYDLESGAERRRWPPGPAAGVLAFHPRGDRLAVFSANPCVVQIRALDTGKPMRTLPLPSLVRGLAWNRDGSLLAAACGDYRIHVWNADTGQSQALLEGHQNAVVHVVFNRADLLVSTAWDATMRLWNPWNGELLAVAAVAPGIAQFSSDGQRLACHLGRNKVALWNVVTSPVCRTLSGPSANRAGPFVSFSPDGRWLLTAGPGLRLWDVNTARCVQVLAEEDSRAGCFHPDGHSLFTCGRAAARRWPIRSETKAPAGTLALGPAEQLDGGNKSRSALALAGKSRVFALVLDEQETAIVFRGDNFDEKVGLRGHTGMRSVALSPDGEWAATGSWHGKDTRVWNARTGALVETLPGGDAHVAFSPDGRWLVTGTAEEYGFWKVGTWQPGLRIARDDPGVAGPLAFSADGRYLAIAHTGKEVRVVDSATGREVVTLSAPHPRPITSLAFSPDGGRLAVGHMDHTVQLWDWKRLRQQMAEAKLDQDLPSLVPAP